MSLVNGARARLRSRTQVVGGVALCAGLGLSAFLLSPIVPAPLMVLALLLGMIARAVIPSGVAQVDSGVKFCAREVLRAGVALLGLRVAVSDIVALGPHALVVVLISLVVTLTSGYAIARLLKQPADVATTSATSVAVCGASAALAASAVAPQREGLDKQTAAIIVAVSLLSTVVMVLYPWLSMRLGFGDHATAILLGAAIHDVAQVAGAGFSISDTIGVEAVTVKMIRVACLLPVVIVVGYHLSRAGAGAAENARLPAPPAFLLAFFALSAIVSIGLVPAPVISAGANISSWSLAIAVAAIGVKTSIGDLRRVDPRLILGLSLQTIVQLLVVVGLIVILR